MIIPPTAPVKTATQTFTEAPNSLTRIYAAIINNIEDPIVPIRSATSGLFDENSFTE